MSGFLASVGVWNWLILGVVLIIAEVLLPGVFLLWFGVAAILVGAISLAFDASWQTQIVLFAVIALAEVPLWRRFSRMRQNQDGAENLNQRGKSLINREAVLEKPIVDGVGTLSIDDTIWRIEGPNLPVGTRVKVTQVHGSIATVTLANG